ncbi:MAG: response regulator [Oscillospiraceae bacterium]|nr:response regulator [Oscillospiraceae bacterium]
MYNVLLVDDEPLILSGIKFLLDWEKNDCRVANTARNGQDALEKIRAEQPEIVICDINMPTFNGIDLLCTVSKEYPHIVFIMLTNLQDFDLAQAALRHKAVDYILKSQLEAETLEKCLSLAKAESDNRLHLAQKVRGNRYENQSVTQQMQDLFMHATKDSAESINSDCTKLLQQPYCAAYILMDYTSVPGYAQLSLSDIQERFAWQKEMCEKLVRNHFRTYSLFEPDAMCESLVLLCWEVDVNSLQEKMTYFYQKLCAASAKITQATPCVLATTAFQGDHQLSACRTQLTFLRDYFYSTDNAEPLLFTSSCTPLHFQPLGLTGISGKLAYELHSKNIAGCETIFNRAIHQIKTVPHERSRGVWLCGELYGTACEVLQQVINANQLSPYFQNCENAYSQIDRLRTRSQAADWLAHLQTLCCNALLQLSLSRNDFIEKTKQYISQHIYERILLADIADYVCISPSYLSSLFKKMHQKNLVDYINEQKMIEACKMIQKNNLRIYEICYKLGYENPYYFSKIFKRFVGKTPTEYQSHLRKTQDDVTPPKGEF